MKSILKKFGLMIITLIAVSFLAFLAFQIIPGDPTTKLLGTEATAEKVAELRKSMGLDRPVIVRYFIWLKNFIKGDMGISYSYNMAVTGMLAEKIPITLLLTLVSFVITIIVAIPLGIAVGSVRNKVFDRILAILNQVVMSVPPFFIGIIICYVCGLIFRLFIPGNFVSYNVSFGKCIWYLIFPALSVAIPRIAVVIKMFRSSILKELDQNYVTTARSRGTGRNRILWGHVLKNAILPIVTLLALSLAEMMGGIIIIEQIFTIPGIGKLLLSSIGNRDFPVVQAIVVLLAAWIVVVNFLADAINQLIDPRLRL